MVANRNIAVAVLVWVAVSCATALAQDEFWKAIYAGDVTTVQRLLTAKPELAKLCLDDSYTPLGEAIRSSKPAMVKLLLDHKVDPNREVGNSECGHFYLQMAIELRSKELVELLLKYGANANAKSVAIHPPRKRWEDRWLIGVVGGVTPLHWAAERGTKEIVESLLARKADVNAKDEIGHTPLHMAVRGGKKDVVELLVARQADINAKTTGFHPYWNSIGFVGGDTPLDYANPEVAAVLVRHGAKSGKQ